MAYQLKNQHDSQKSIQINNETWYSLLEMAEDYGWSPLGTVLPDRFGLAGFFVDDPDQWYGDYWSPGSRLVLIDDALNLGDALYEAYLDYEPIHAERLYSYFGGNGLSILNRPQPSIGSLMLVFEFCLRGPFYIEML